MTARGTVDEGSARRSTVQLMFDRCFGALFWGKTFANIGVWVHNVAAVIVVFQATGSAAAVSMVSVAQFAPQLVLAPVSGTWADRGDRVLQMILGRLLCIVGSGSLCLTLWLLDPSGGRAVLYVALSSLLVGFGFVVGGPAAQSIVPDLVRPSELPTAMMLNAVPVTAGRVFGPVIGAYAVAQLSVPVAFAVATFSHVVLLAVLLVAPLPRTTTGAADHSDFSVRASLSYVRQDPTLQAMLLATVAIGAGSEPMLTLAPALADDLGGAARLVGLLTFCFGLGAVLGTVSTTYGSRLVGSTVLTRAGLLALAAGGFSAASVTLVGAFMGMVLAGIGLSWGMAASSTVIQQQTDKSFRGRVMALWLLAFIGTRPISAAAIGAVADLGSVRLACALTAALVMAVALACREPRGRPGHRWRDDRARPGQSDPGRPKPG